MTLLVVILAVAVCAGGIDADFANDFGLPGGGIYKPDLGEAADAGGPIVSVINFIIGFIGLIVLAWGVVCLIKDHGLKLITGKRSLKDPDIQAKLIGFVAGAALIFLAITGAWFVVLKFVWGILQSLLNKLG